MRIVVISGAGGTLGDDMVFRVIKDWLEEFGINVVLNPSIEDFIEPDFLEHTHGLIIGGCGIIYDEGVVIDGGENPHRYHRYVTIAKNHDIPMIGFGLGWQGLSLASGKDVWVDIFNMLDFLVVWNQQTKDYLESIGVTSEITATCDLGFALKPIEQPVKFDYGLLTHPPNIMTKDCHKPEWEAEMEFKLQSAIIYLAQYNSTIIISFCQFFTKYLLELASHTHSPIITGGDPRQILGIIGGIDVCITTTLHALISAATAGCKVVALYPPEPLKPKIRWMAEELGVRSLPFNAELHVIVQAAREAKNDNLPDITKQLEHNKHNKEILREWVNDIINENGSTTL